MNNIQYISNDFWIVNGNIGKRNRVRWVVQHKGNYEYRFGYS